MWLDCEESADGEFLLEGSCSAFVPVVFAEDLSDAERYRGLLETVSIPAVIELPGDDAPPRLSIGGAVPVRVPEDLHDAASEVVAAAQREVEELRGDFDDDFDDEDDDDLDDEDDLDEPDDDEDNLD